MKNEVAGTIAHRLVGDVVLAGARVTRLGHGAMVGGLDRVLAQRDPAAEKVLAAFVHGVKANALDIAEQTLEPHAPVEGATAHDLRREIDAAYRAPRGDRLALIRQISVRESRIKIRAPERDHLVEHRL